MLVMELKNCQSYIINIDDTIQRILELGSTTLPTKIDIFFLQTPLLIHSADQHLLSFYGAEQRNVH